MKPISRALILISASSAAAVLAFGVALFAQTNEATSDVQLHAMADELARAKTLQLASLDKPYFISYSSDDADMFMANGSLGGLLFSRRSRLRQPHIHIRVGDFSFDNTDSVT